MGGESYTQFVARLEGTQGSQGTVRRRPLWLSVLLFLAVFTLLQASFNASRGSAFEHAVVGSLTVAPVAALIRTLTPGVAVQAVGNQLIAPGGGIVVKKGCEGVEVMFMLMAAFAAAAMPWRRCLMGLSLGLPLVYVLNQLRLAALFYAWRSDPGLFNFLHGTLAPLLLVAAVGLYALWWLPRPVLQPVTA